MDIRVLRYLLTIAEVGNISKAAEILHITQPTLSRQIMDLESEVGDALLVRGKRKVTLTSTGILLQQRAKEIIALFEKTERELENHKNLTGGVVSIGCVESKASLLLADVLAKFYAGHPQVQFDIYSANGDDIREKLDRDILDIGILLEPVETAKYDYFQLPCFDVWGLLARKDDPLASKNTIRVEDIEALPLIVPTRKIVRDEVAGWFGDSEEHLRVFASNNLLTNATLLVERGLGYVVTVEGSYCIRPSDALAFVPFCPERKSGHVLAWKKSHMFGEATARFVEYIRMLFEHDNSAK